MPRPAVLVAVRRGQAHRSGALGKEYAAGALLFDWISRPDSFAYDWKGGNSPQVKLARFMGAVPVSWTVRSRDEFAQCCDQFDRHIFEAFVPDEQ